MQLVRKEICVAGTAQMLRHGQATCGRTSARTPANGRTSARMRRLIQAPCSGTYACTRATGCFFARTARKRRPRQLPCSCTSASTRASGRSSAPTAHTRRQGQVFRGAHPHAHRRAAHTLQRQGQVFRRCTSARSAHTARTRRLIQAPCTPPHTRVSGPYLCSACGEAFVHLNRAKRHVALASTAMAAACCFCHRAFADVAAAQACERAHTDGANV
jgi:hypothetical protein